MKRLLIICIITLSIVSITDAQYYNRHTSENTIELKNGEPLIKEYGTKQLNELKLNNKHGFVNVSTWDKEMIRLEVIVNIETSNEFEAEEILKLIEFKDRTYSHKLDFKTVFLDDFFSNYPFTINYTITVPARLDLTINNSIGDVKIENSLGQINLTHSYGNLELKNIATDKKHQMNLSFVEGLIDSFGTTIADFSNCTLNINNGQKVAGSTSYCMASFNNIMSADIKSFTDRLTITKSDSIKLIGSQFIGKIEQVKTSVFCELDRGKLLVDADESIKKITISNKRVNTTLIIPPTISYLINGEVFNGTFTHPTPQKLQLFKEDDNVTFSGQIGIETNEPANIILFNKEASITIKN
ncbi:hypothetical protein J1N10_17035 [Carboxylicivirga sp. A043]|uniref:hypothetical protein n=1 Tax=Carboxylicivirga litoralis TaxID=2816963 RepID=UPI0021CB51D7|nr:hypothetical protein [Carboxylicivirga sp. A043]MCU4157684.1 hypothetical protein [Carboxylicivirga sp. A043]